MHANHDVVKVGKKNVHIAGKANGVSKAKSPPPGAKHHPHPPPHSPAAKKPPHPPAAKKPPHPPPVAKPPKPPGGKKKKHATVLDAQTLNACVLCLFR